MAALSEVRRPPNWPDPARRAAAGAAEEEGDAGVELGGPQARSGHGCCWGASRPDGDQVSSTLRRRRGGRSSLVSDGYALLPEGLEEADLAELQTSLQRPASAPHEQAESHGLSLRDLFFLPGKLYQLLKVFFGGTRRALPVTAILGCAAGVVGVGLLSRELFRCLAILNASFGVEYNPVRRVINLMGTVVFSVDLSVLAHGFLVACLAYKHFLCGPRGKLCRSRPAIAGGGRSEGEDTEMVCSEDGGRSSGEGASPTDHRGVEETPRPAKHPMVRCCWCCWRCLRCACICLGRCLAWLCCTLCRCCACLASCCVRHCVPRTLVCFLQALRATVRGAFALTAAVFLWLSIILLVTVKQLSLFTPFLFRGGLLDLLSFFLFRA
mmetsp:Transcript_53407/g.121750  ORF Transcript_53407/g.121750 Transcript_53407/m.121750 type:complete len:382 (-) Transcript_53407:432-1577(-)